MRRTLLVHREHSARMQLHSQQLYERTHISCETAKTHTHKHTIQHKTLHGPTFNQTLHVRVLLERHKTEPGAHIPHFQFPVVSARRDQRSCEVYTCICITSSHHHIITSSHHIITSHHHIITSSHHHITSSHHHIITSSSHRITSHRITSHHITWHRMASHGIASHRIAWHHMASRRIDPTHIAIAPHRTCRRASTAHQLPAAHNREPHQLQGSGELCCVQSGWELFCRYVYSADPRDRPNPSNSLCVRAEEGRAGKCPKKPPLTYLRARRVHMCSIITMIASVLRRIGI